MDLSIFEKGPEKKKERNRNEYLYSRCLYRQAL